MMCSASSWMSMGGPPRSSVRARVLALHDAGQQAHDVGHLRAVEVEPLAARDDRLGDLVRLGGRQHEDDVVRRLLERLEQRVEGLAREHVDLVDDVDLEAAVDRREGDLVAQVAHVVDAAVGGGVHLDDVEGRAVGDGDAVAADAAGRGRRAVTGAVRADAVERLGEDARGARLAGAARPREDVGVGDLVGLDRVAQGARDVVLSDELGEGLGAVLAVERALHRTASVPRGREKKVVAHPPSKRVLRASSPCASSGQATPRHMEWPAYRCFLPDLTGFAGFHCVGPDLQRRDTADSLAERPLGREFSPAVADCGYRAPLAPRLARPLWRLPARPGGSKRRRARRRAPPRGPRRPRTASGAVNCGMWPAPGTRTSSERGTQRVQPLGRARAGPCGPRRRRRSPAARARPG